MTIEFVGREAELKRFNALLKQSKGELWAIRGEGGLGKSSLLREFIKLCEQNKRDYLFIDIERLSTYKTAAEFLLSLPAPHLPEFEKAQQKAQGIYQTIQAQLQTGLKTFAPELQEAITGAKEIYITEEYEKNLYAVADKYLGVLVKTGIKLFNSEAEAEKKQIAENIEGFLISCLKDICAKNPVIFIDTYEHLEVKTFLETQTIGSQLTKDFDVSKNIVTYKLGVWINQWFAFLQRQGAMVLIAGRQFKAWQLQAKDLSRFNEEEIKDFIFKCEYPEICAIRDDEKKQTALLAVLKKLSFDGSPLWLAVGLNLVVLLLAEGKEITALVQADNTLKRCFEEIDGTLEPDEIQHASCKLAIFNRITRQLSSEVVENAWRLALPRYLDKDILKILLGESAEDSIELYKSLQILNFKRSESRFFLHESIRDLLIFYATHKGYWNSELATQLHEKLAKWFEQKAQRKAVFLEKIEVEWLDLPLAEEMYFHRNRGIAVDLESSMGEKQYWLARACQAIQENEENEWGWFQLGYIFINLTYCGNDAIENFSFDKSPQLQSAFINAWCNSKLEFNDLIRYEGAVQCYGKAIQLKTDFIQALFHRGVVFDFLAHYEKAIEDYEKAVQLKPDYVDAWLNCGVASWKLGLFTKAAESFAQVLTILPNNLSALSNDIELALVQNDLERMQQRLAVALPLLNNNIQEFVILPFLQWIANLESSLQPVLTAIQQLSPTVKIGWNFSDVQPAILRLSPEHQQIAQQFIDYFQGKISFETLQTSIPKQLLNR